ncbi:hypothetical protein ACRRTK_003178 [Alexandromys fortis]
MEEEIKMTMAERGPLPGRIFDEPKMSMSTISPGKTCILNRDANCCLPRALLKDRRFRSPFRSSLDTGWERVKCDRCGNQAAWPIAPLYLLHVGDTKQRKVSYHNYHLPRSICAANGCWPQGSGTKSTDGCGRRDMLLKKWFQKSRVSKGKLCAFVAVSSRSSEVLGPKLAKQTAYGPRFRGPPCSSQTHSSGERNPITIHRKAGSSVFEHSIDSLKPPNTNNDQKNTTNSSGRQKKIRIVYSEEQKLQMQELFNECKTPSREKLMELAQRICVTEHQIQIWFKNQRAKHKQKNPQTVPKGDNWKL